MVAEPDRDRKDDTKMSNVQHTAFTDLNSTVSFGGGGGGGGGGNRANRARANRARQQQRDRINGTVVSTNARVCSSINSGVPGVSMSECRNSDGTRTVSQCVSSNTPGISAEVCRDTTYSQ